MVSSISSLYQRFKNPHSVESQYLKSPSCIDCLSFCEVSPFQISSHLSSNELPLGPQVIQAFFHFLDCSFHSPDTHCHTLPSWKNSAFLNGATQNPFRFTLPFRLSQQTLP